MKPFFTIKFCLSFVFALSLLSETFAQITVTGKITSAEDSASLPGVNVVVKGTT